MVSSRLRGAETAGRVAAGGTAAAPIGVLGGHGGLSVGRRRGTGADGSGAFLRAADLPGRPARGFAADSVGVEFHRAFLWPKEIEKASNDSRADFFWAAKSCFAIVLFVRLGETAAAPVLARPKPGHREHSRILTVSLRTVCSFGHAGSCFERPRARMACPRVRAVYPLASEFPFSRKIRILLFLPRRHGQR